MKSAAAYPLLITFAVIELVIAVLMFTVFHNVAIGASSIAIGASLFTIATSMRKKQSNG